MIDETNDPLGEEMTADERELDALVTRLAQSYHRPPDIVPADQMWARIQERRRAARPVHRHQGLILLAASAAFLAIGIGIGRWGGPGAGSGAGAPSRGVGGLTPARNVASAAAQPRRGEGAADADTAALVQPFVVPSPRERSEHAPGARSATTPRDGARSASSTSRDAAPDPSTAYQLATIRHFTQVEALLTSFESNKRDAKMDAQMAAWGRDLLGQTRLLLDSPAANDPVRRKLLQDLELVLVQITQLSPSAAPVERDMIDGAVRASDVMPRLRTAVPAGGATHFNGV
jgi:hypothetical protein